ncbi:MAG: carbohydrate binding domain-containing protein, partial [Bacteroidota bacterium]
GWQVYTIPFTVTGFTGTVTNARLRFAFNGLAAAGDVYFLDDVSLAPGSGATAPALITQDPSPRTVEEGQTAAFAVAAAGTPAPSFQWQKNGVDIPGAGGASYTTPPATLADNGAAFRCIAFNSTGRDTSAAAILTVTPLPAANLVANPGFESGTAGWSFYTNGTGSFSAVAPGFAGSQAGRVLVTIPGTNVQLYQSGITLGSSVRYRLSFAAYSPSGHDLSVYIHKQASPFTNYGLNGFTADLTPAWQTFSVLFNPAGFAGTVTDARLRFWLAPFASAGDAYFIDNVVLQPAPTEEPPSGTWSRGSEPAEPVPADFALRGNYPNPFNPSTMIEYWVPEDAHVRMAVFNVLGQETARLMDGAQRAGVHTVSWDGRDALGGSVGSGVYFLRMQATTASGRVFSALQKMVLAR